MIFLIGFAALALLFIYSEFYLPGGVMACAGAILAMLAMGGSFYYGTTTGWIFSISMVFAIGIIIMLGIRHARKNLSLSHTQEGYVGCDFNEHFIGMEAVVVKDLRPSGFIEVEGVVCQALSQGEYIKKNVKVTVIGGQGAHLIVR